jgi:SAM-dependent methyltransferase
MLNEGQWVETKYAMRKGRLRASGDRRFVSPGSKLATNLVAMMFGKYLQLYAKGRLVDLGCGDVPLYCAYRDLVDENVCIDWGSSTHENSHLDFEADLSEPLAIPDRAFNTVILSDVLEHIRDPRGLTREVGRILAVDGYLLMSVPFYYCLHEVPHDYYRYTEHGLREMLESAGLQIEILETTGGTLEILSDIVAKHLQFLPVLGPSIASSLQNFSFWFRCSSMGCRIAARTGKSFPLSYFVVARKKLTSA